MASVEIKKRNSRATQEQLHRMVSYFYENVGLAEGKFAALQGKVAFNKKWQDLSLELNAMGGANKSTEQWQTVWRDLKSRVSLKMRQRRKEMAQTGNKPLSIDTLNELERKVIGLLGKEYVDGSENCPDSLPESEDLQLQLEDGNESALLQSPQLLNVFQRNGEASLPTTPKTPRRAPKRKASNNFGEENIRGEFLKIAQQQSNSMEMLAEAAKKSAEAVLRRVDVLNKIADTLIDIKDQLLK